MCHRVGQEREAERQALIGRFEALPLAEKEAAPREIGLIPKVVAVQADGGRYQQRTWDGDAVLPHADDESHTATEGQAGEPSEDVTFATAAEPAVSACTAPSAAAEPSEPLPEPERKGCWREDKIGVLLKFNSETHEFDPAPRVPEGFLDIIAMGQLAQEVKNARQPEPGQTFGDKPEDEESGAEGSFSAATTYATHRPEIVGKQVVATTKSMSVLGALLAAQAWALGFFGAERRAFLGDGLRANWTLWRTRFPTFVPILDFIHLLTYVYAAAFAGQTRAVGTRLYQTWIQWAWSGRVDDLIAALEQRLRELPSVVKGDSTSPQSVVHAALRYIRNNQTRMNYPEYRRQGLPITTSLIESTVKQINYRVKGTEKFWSRDGIEAVLHLRADVLSEFDTLDDFFVRREAKANGMRAYRQKVSAAA